MNKVMKFIFVMIIGLVCVLVVLQNSSFNFEQDNDPVEEFNASMENNLLMNGTTDRWQEKLDKLEERLQMAIINQDDDEAEAIEEELADLRDEMESHMD